MFNKKPGGHRQTDLQREYEDSMVEIRRLAALIRHSTDEMVETAERLEKKANEREEEAGGD